jgi:hypothetical protein
MKSREMDNKMDVNDEEPPPSQERVRRRSVRNRSQRSQSPRRSRSLSPRRKRASPQERPRSYEKKGRKSIEVINPSDLTAEKLCRIAISDLYHDFKDNKEAIDTAPFSIPHLATMCKHDDEEKILQQLLGLTRDGENHFIEPKPQNKANTLLKDYNCAFINKPYYEKGKHTLNEAFQTITGKGDIFLVVDFFYSGFKDALVHLKGKDGPTLYWVQNRQTLYDPAGKAHPQSDAGKKMFQDNPRVKFCWENTTTTKFLPREIYPFWSKSWDKPIQRLTLQNKNELFFSKNEMNLVIQSNPQNDYESQEAVCILKTEDKKTVIMSKEMASKNAGPLSKGEYAALESMLRKSLQGGSLQPNSSISAVRRTIEQHHVAAKRLGDQGQALSCLKAGQLFHYMKNDREETIALNGLNCFVTHDRLAMAAAIAYQVPIVIYLYYGDTHFAMFIKNDLLDEVTQKRFAISALQKQIENMLEERNTVGSLYDQAVESVATRKESLREYDKSLNDFKNKIRNQLQSYQNKFQTLLDAESVETSELLYQHFVFDLFKFVPYMTEFLYLFEKSKKPVEEILSRLQRTLDDFDAKQRALTQQFQATQQKIQQEQERQKTQAKPKTYKQIIDAYSNFLVDLETNIVELRQMIGNIHDDLNFYIYFENAAAKMKKVCDGPEPSTIPIADAINIEQSHLFKEEGPTSRQFISKAEQFTLRSYLLKIKDMLHTMGSAFQNKDVQNFLYTLGIIVGKAKVGSMNEKKYDSKVSYLYQKFPELVPKNGGSTSRRRTRRRMMGGTTLQQSQCKEAILRSAFGLLYAAWENDHPFMDSKGEKWDQDKLNQLYNKFNPNGAPRLVEGDLPKGDTAFSYYIPFLQEQIVDTGDKDLVRMQKEAELANEIEVKLQIPKTIEDRLYAFLQENTSANSFFQSSVRSLTVKQGSPRVVSKPESKKLESKKPIIKTIWDYVQNRKPSSVLQPYSMITGFVSNKKGGKPIGIKRTKKYKNKSKNRQTKKRY